MFIQTSYYTHSASIVQLYCVHAYHCLTKQCPEPIKGPGPLQCHYYSSLSTVHYRAYKESSHLAVSDLRLHVLKLIPFHAIIIFNMHACMQMGMPGSLSLSKVKSPTIRRKARRPGPKTKKENVFIIQNSDDSTEPTLVYFEVPEVLYRHIVAGSIINFCSYACGNDLQ